MPEELGEDLPEDVLPLYAEMGPVGFQPYVLDLAAMGHGTQAISSTLVFVVMTRNDGLLLALPELALLGEVLETGMHADPLALVGPHTRLLVQAAALDEDAVAQEPEPVPGETISTLLVDFSVGVLPYPKSLNQLDDLADTMAFDVLNTSWVPLPSDLVSKAISWAAGMESSDRLQFYSADEAEPPPPSPPARPDAKRRAAPAGATPGGRAPKSVGKKKVTVASLAESLDQITQALPALSSQLHDLSQRTAAIEAGTAKTSDRASALRRPLGSLAMDGSASPSNLGGLVKAMPPPRGSARQATPRVSFGPAETTEIAEDLRGDQSDLAKAVLAQSQALTESDSLQLRRPTAGHGLFLSLDFKQGLDGQSEAAKRTCCPERGLFHECFAEHVTEDVSLTAGRGRDVSAATEGRYAYPVFGEIWGLRQIQRSGLHHLAGWTLHELPSGGQPPCRQGCPELAVRLSRTISDGWWQDGCGPSPSPSGGPATDPVFGSVSCGRSKSQTFCTDSQPALGHDSLAVFEGVGCNQQQTGRSNQQPTEQCRSRGIKCDTKRAPPTQEGGGKRSSKSKGGRFSECRGRDIAGNSDEKELEACIDFQTFLASLPRCILRSRTSFSTFLAMSFHTKRCGDSPATAIFPLPIPIVGLFQKQRVPKLNAKKWRKLCLRRALHVLVVALNYIHNGMKMAPLAALGRRPNMAQKAVYQRLQALLIACEKPRDFPLPPGRSGFEFIAIHRKVD